MTALPLLCVLSLLTADGGVDAASPTAEPTAVIRVEPGTPKPGELVMVTLYTTKKSKPPTGNLGGRSLSFFAFPRGFRALVPLSVDLPTGPLALKVTPSKGAPPLLSELEVLDPKFRESELTVAKKFLSPPKSVKKQIAEDKAAFARAYDQPVIGPSFSRNFQWPRHAPVTAPFGDRRVFNGRLQSQHYGTDIDGRTGEDIASANDGTVVMARNCYASGGTVIVYHGVNLYTAYFHMSRIDVKEGDRVKRGGHLGLVGKTGRVTGPHLHWAVKVHGMYVNPESLLRLDFEH